MGIRGAMGLRIGGASLRWMGLSVQHAHSQQKKLILLATESMEGAQGDWGSEGSEEGLA